MADLLNELFGTDSDEEQVPEVRDGEAGPSAPAAYDPYGVEGRTKEELFKATGLEDSDVEVEDGAQPKGEGEGGAADDAPADEETGKRRPKRRDGIEPDEPGDYELHLFDHPDPRTLSVARLGHNLGFEVLPYSDEDYGENPEEQQRRPLAYLTKIRWRPASKEAVPDLTQLTAEDRAKLHASIQSNARVVTWSDGSVQLLIGDEAFDVAAADTMQDHNYLFAQHSGKGSLMLQGQAHLTRKLQFRPASERTAVSALQLAAKKQKAVATARHYMPTMDPEKQKELELKKVLEEQRINERAEKRKLRVLQGGAGAERRAYRSHAAITKDFLEANENLNYINESEEEEEEEMEEGERRRAAFKRMDRNRRNVEDEGEGERRILEAKRGQKRARDEDEEEEDVDDFIVDDIYGEPAKEKEKEEAAEISDVSEEEGEESEDDAAENLVKRRRGVLAFSDDDD